jgi:phosphatidylglycerophosphate synthase
MVVAAVIVGPNGGCSPLSPFGGLSLCKRAVLTAQKAGASRCFLHLAGDTSAVRQELQHDPRITSQLVWSPDMVENTDDSESEACWLVYPLNSVFRHPLVTDLLAQHAHLAQKSPLIVTDHSGDPLLALVSEPESRQLWQELTQGKTLRETTVFAGGGGGIRIAPPPGHFLHALQAGDDMAGQEHRLLRSLENSRDGVVDTYLNRFLSRPITRWFLRTSITPNQVTLLAGLMSILGALCFLPGGYLGPLLGALLLQFSAVLDCCDGEIARIKFMESPLGDTLDIVCDTVGAIAIFLGMGVAVWKNGVTEYALVLGGILALGGALSFPLVTLAEKTEEAGKQRAGWEDTIIQHVLISLTNRDYSVLILGSALVGQLSWFLWGAAVGAHVFWLLLAWLLFRAGRFGLARSVWERKGI